MEEEREKHTLNHEQPMCQAVTEKCGGSQNRAGGTERSGGKRTHRRRRFFTRTLSQPSESLVDRGNPSSPVKGATVSDVIDQGMKKEKEKCTPSHQSQT
jgi:hypothetical protein